jgi:hypothetical protein
MPKDGLLSGLGLPLRVSREEEHNGTKRVRRTPLATLLVSAGFVTTDQVEDANAEASRTGDRLGEVVVRHGWASEEDVARLLAEQHELPFLSGDDFAVEDGCDKLMRPERAHRLEACPVGFVDGSVVVAIDDPAELRFKEVRELLGDSTLFVVVTPTTLKTIHGEIWSGEDAPAPVAPPEPREAPPVTPLETGDLLEALGAVEAALAAGTTAVDSLRGRVEALGETAGADRLELEACRSQLAAHDESRQADVERIADLEQQLEQKTQFVNDLKAKLGDVFSGLEAAG